MQLQKIVLCSIKRGKTKEKIIKMKKMMELKMEMKMKRRRKSNKKMKKDNSVDNSKIMMMMMKNIKMAC